MIDHWIPLLLVFFAALDRFGILAYEVCEYRTALTFTYCDDGQYCCHDRKDCCDKPNIFAWTVGLLIGVIATSLVIYCLVRRRRQHWMKAAARSQHVQGVANPAMFVISSQTTQVQPVSPPTYSEAVENSPPPYY